MDLTASYLGLALKSPVVASAGPLNRHLDNLLRLQDCGAGAVVLPSIFEEQIERESVALANSGRLYDDGIIDPRDTRTVLGFCLSVIHNGEVRGQRGYGVFRM